MQYGDISISTITWGMFRLDGGAMFGSVPKNIWSKLIPFDDENCIPLAVRSLLIESKGKKILVDVGMGEKWSDKNRTIFAIRNKTFEELSFNPDSVTDVILTHLHFDHAGGISRWGADGSSIEPVFRNARIHIQKSNFENAKTPSLRERASYLKENWGILDSAEVNFLSGDAEIFSDIFGHEVNGHTRGQQWIEIKAGGETLMFGTDLIPTSRHLPLPYTMGYDICAETVLKEKDAFLKKALTDNAIVIFQHDPDTPAARIAINEKGHYSVLETISL